MWKNKLLLLAIVLSTWPLFLAACTPAEESGSPAAQTVETYLQALADKNRDQMIAASCAAWEGEAQLELDAFVGVETRLEGLACQVTGSDGEATLVSCSGEILATYGAEDRSFPLDTSVFQVVQEGGEWRVCGRQPK